MYELKAVDKKFPGVHALKAVDFHVKRGEIVGLVGENGAGKSTLMKVIYGAYQPDGGTISIDGKPMRFQNPRQAMEKGIGMVFQEQSLISNLTVMENIYLGYEAQFVRMGVINWKAMAEATIEANNGVADASLKAQAQQYGMVVETDKAGKSIVKSMKEAEEATKDVGKAAKATAETIAELSEAGWDAANDMVAQARAHNAAMATVETSWLDATAAASKYSQEMAAEIGRAHV